MNTETVIDGLVADAPPMQQSVDDIIGMGRRFQRRRRTQWVALAACALAVLFVSAGVVVPRVLDWPDPGVRSPQPSHIAAAGAAPPTTANSAAPAVVSTAPFSFTLRGYTRGPLRVDSPRTVSTAYQAAAVYSESEHVGYLTVFRPHAYDSGTIAGRPATTITGRRAAQWSRQRKVELPGGGWTMTDHFLTWEYAEDAWATLETFSRDANAPSAQNLRDVAEGLLFGPAVPAKLPFTLSYLPAGYRPVEVGMHAWAGKNGLAAIEENNPGGVIFAEPAPKAVGLDGVWDQNSPLDIPNNFDIAVQPDKPRARPAGGSCSSTSTVCVQWRDGGRIKLYVDQRSSQLSVREMQKVLSGVKFANADDESTWTEVAKAIPTR